LGSRESSGKQGGENIPYRALHGLYPYCWPSGTKKLITDLSALD